MTDHKTQEEALDAQTLDTLDADQEAFGQLLATMELGVDLDDERAHRETVRPPLDSVQSLGFTLGGLSVMTLDGEGDEGQLGPLRLERTLGAGAMGEVWLAQQVPLDRDVAVKRVKDKARGVSTNRSILREAWITGRLEHPNVVPVHDLGLDQHGSPVMVMKRIEGVSWQDILDEPSLMPERHAGMDVLEGHLRILMEVCDAIHFAHTRNILHRDIKPDNVMLGPFGEIYVVDWGIAVSTRDDGRGRLPLASDANKPAGTPVYMAPEMAAGQGNKLGPHSDVFSLGAVLHQLITGEVRHKGATPMQVLMNAYVCEPFEYDLEVVPAELAALCQRAMAREVEHRLGSVEAFRGALESFLHHRDSWRLGQKALELLGELKAAIVARERHKIRELYGACNFGFQQSLGVWADNDAAQRGRHEMLLEMAGFELDEQQPEAAAYLLEQIQSPSGPHASRLEALRGRLEVVKREVEALRSLRHETNLGVFSRRRGLLAAGLGLVWALNGFRRSADLPEHAELVGNQLVMIGAVSLLVGLSRKWMLGTLINRKITAALFGILFVDLVVRWVGWHLKVPILDLAAMEQVADMGSVVFIALLIDVRLLVTAAVMVVAVVFTAYFPEKIYSITAWSNLFALLSVTAIWFKKAPSMASVQPQPSNAVQNTENDR